MNCKCFYTLLYWKLFKNGFIIFIISFFVKLDFEWSKETKYMIKYTLIINVHILPKAQTFLFILVDVQYVFPLLYGKHYLQKVTRDC